MTGTITRAISTPAAAFEVTRNSCVVCAPLGASLAFAGVAGGMVLLHGSQGCATYIRRYTISHFREPLDAASSSFTEESAVFGGASNLRQAFQNLVRQYDPSLIGVATTCLAETIGEDASTVRSALGDLMTADGPLVATVSTPSYRGDHREGFRAALRSLAEAACPKGKNAGGDGSPSEKPIVAVFPTLLSPADLRWLKRTIGSFGLRPILVSDYSDTLDGGPWMAYRHLPVGGTKVEDLKQLDGSILSLELGLPVDRSISGGAYLEDQFGVPREQRPLPLGVAATDAFLESLSALSGRPIPADLEGERARLLDSFVDAHKIVFGRRALLYGDKDLVAALTGFCQEVGLDPVVAEGEGRDFASVKDAADRAAQEGRPIDIMIGNSKGYRTARSLDVPLVRLGFPVHDRYGGQRLRALGYEGTQELFDRVTNALVERAQEESDVGYTYY